MTKTHDKILVAVMGATGTGKSTFVNLLTGKEDAKVAHGLFSGTSSVSTYDLTFKSRDFLIIDTPGFDDTQLSDREILRILVTWLETSFRAGQKLAGIIYFHRITDPRMQGSALANLQTFKKLCGQNCFSNIILGTSFWGVVDKATGEEREKQLKENGEFWAGMIRGGSRVVRIPESQQAARDLIFRFASNKPSVLQYQREVVLEGKSFDQTAAHRELQTEEALQKQREENEKQKREKDARHRAELRAREEKAFKKEQAARQEEQRKIAAQETERKRLEAERVAEEAKRERARAAAKAERERLDREAADLAEKMAKLKVERANASRRRILDQYMEEIHTSLEILATAKEANKIMVNFREVSPVYSITCDNCFCSIGSASYYKCLICSNGEFYLCCSCYAAPGVYCEVKSHFTDMEKVDAWTGGNGNCRRVHSPIPVGSDLHCSRCFDPCGAVYLHCCFCDNDNFDMCVSCALQFKTCKKSWSLSGHPLDVCARYTGKAL